MPKFVSTIFQTSGNKLASFLAENFDLTRNGCFLQQKHYPDQGTAIEIIEKDTAKTLKKNAPYWKIGFSMPDVAKQAGAVRAKGIEVSQEAQFKDIGFVAHTADSDGSTIELIQHDFEQNFKGPHDQNPITLGQVTIRTSKLEETLHFYKNVLGMKMLSVQPVDEFGFCLYFLTYTDDVPPQADDLCSVENREWLWKKQYCTIEIQHVTSRHIADYEDLTRQEAGWAGMRVRMMREEARRMGIVEDSGLVRDPNNIPIFVEVID